MPKIIVNGVNYSAPTSGDSSPYENGTGGISVGTGLLTSSENVYNEMLPVTEFEKMSYTGISPPQESYGGETYYYLEYTTDIKQDSAAYDFFITHINEDLLEELPNVSPGLYVSNETFWDHIDYAFVIAPNRLKIYISDYGWADNAPVTLSIGFKELTYTNTPLQTIFGAFNRNNAKYEPKMCSILEVGNGTASSRANAMRLSRSNKMYLGAGGAYNSSGADHAEFTKEWADGNTNNEDRVGYMVSYVYTEKGIFIQKANPGDYIAGITSGNPCLVGNADENYYWRYERDEFNRIIMEDVPETIPATDDDGNPLFDEETHEPILEETGRTIKTPKVCESYDPSLSYVPRSSRPEWDYVGMCGVIPVRDDGTCIPGRFCKCGDGGIATLAEKRDFDTFFVLERISENIVSVELRGI